MSNKLYEETNISAIADAIRAKGVSGTMTVAQMSAKVAAIPTKETVTWHQCPEAVRNYLANVTYDPSDYTTSQIASYAPATAVLSNTKPIGKTVDGVTYYNEVPNVATPFSSTNTAGTVKPLDALRWINTPNAVNVRDIGGWTCDGGTVKYGMFFRGGELSADDRDVLVNQCGVRAELNLLGTDSTRTTSILGEDIVFERPSQYVWYSLEDHDGGHEAWVSIISFAFECAKYRRPMYFHCSAGADRTGTVAYILEALLGMSQSDMDKDYELTSFSQNSSNFRQRNGYGLIKSLVAEVNALNGSTFAQKVINWVGNTLHFSADQINAYRRSMIDGNPSDVHIDAQYTNLVPTSVDTDGTVFNGVGYKDGYRLGSNGMPSSLSGCTCCGFIPAVKGDVIRFKGGLWNLSETGSQYSQKCYFHEMSDKASGTAVTSLHNAGYTMPKTGDVYEHVVGSANCQYIRLNVVGNGADLIVTKNEPIV